MEHKATQERSAAFSDGSGLSRQRSELYQSDGGMPAGHPHLGNLQIADDIQWELLKQSQVTSLHLGMSLLFHGVWIRLLTLVASWWLAVGCGAEQREAISSAVGGGSAQRASRHERADGDPDARCRILRLVR